MGGTQAVLDRAQRAQGLRVRTPRGGIVTLVREAVGWLVEGWARSVSRLGPSVLDK